MRFWLSTGIEVPIREQLVTQVVLAILSDDLHPGARLPSTRQLARHFHIHPNTVSAAYRALERDGWVVSRRGSGVFVQHSKPVVEPSPALALDQMILGLFRSARNAGAPLSLVNARLRHWLALQPPDHFLLIEPEKELRDIVISEMRQVLTLPVRGCDMEECQAPEMLAGAIAVALPSKVSIIRRRLPAGVDCLQLRVSSVPRSLARWLPAKQEFLIGVASNWPNFLKSARTMLIAAGFHPDGLAFHDARKPGWESRLGHSAAVVCDSLTASRVPKGRRVIVFPLLAESSLTELRRYEKFIKGPLGL